MKATGRMTSKTDKEWSHGKMAVDMRVDIKKV